MNIAIDFDGTCVKHDFPRIGESIGAEKVLIDLVLKGHKLILNTMRSDIENPVSVDEKIIAEGGDYLTQAVNWFKERNIPLYGVQKNPEQHKWTHSTKVHADLYIDDLGFGCPIITTLDNRVFVDWERVEEMFKDAGVL